jgi:hypothetical protein
MILLAAVIGMTGVGCVTHVNDPGEPSSINVINNSSYSIWKLNISVSSDTVWSDDLLGSQEITPGNSFEVTRIPAARYNLRAIVTGDSYYATSYKNDITAGGSFQWNITDEMMKPYKDDPQPEPSQSCNTSTHFQYTNNKYGVRFCLPDEWEVSEEEDSVIAGESMNVSEFVNFAYVDTVNVHVAVIEVIVYWPVSGMTDLDKLLTFGKTSASDIMDGTNVSGQKTSFNGYDAVTVTYDRLGGELDIRSIDIWFPYSTALFQLHCSTVKADYSMLESKFLEIAGGMEFFSGTFKRNVSALNAQANEPSVKGVRSAMSQIDFNLLQRKF